MSRKSTIHLAEKTDVGRVRSENQDSCGGYCAKGFQLSVVCDGMGGHAGGSTASRLAVETVIATAKEDSSKDYSSLLKNAVEKANRVVFETAQANASLRGMGTTCVVALLDKKAHVAHVAHVGDSRIYLARGEEFARLTKDHTMVQPMVDDGILTEEQAAGHPHANVISRSLGSGITVDVEQPDVPIELQTGDIFLLCSDGLTGPVTDDEMARLVWEYDLEEACDRLVRLANARGGEDNTTVQLIRFGPQSKLPTTATLVQPGSARDRILSLEPISEDAFVYTDPEETEDLPVATTLESLDTDEKREKAVEDDDDESSEEEEQQPTSDDDESTDPLSDEDEEPLELEDNGTEDASEDGSDEQSIALADTVEAAAATNRQEHEIPEKEFLTLSDEDEDDDDIPRTGGKVPDPTFTEPPGGISVLALVVGVFIGLIVFLAIYFVVNPPASSPAVPAAEQSEPE